MPKFLKATTLEDAKLEANEHLEGGFSFQFMYELDAEDAAKHGGTFEVRMAHEDKYAMTLSVGKWIARRTRKESYAAPDGSYTWFPGEEPESWHEWKQVTPPDPMDELFKFLKQRK